MRAAWHLASQSLPDHTSKFSRRDFTLPQLFACLVVKEQMRRSYRGAEALLRDCDSWLRDVGLRRAPDHNTLCRAATFLLTKLRVGRLLDKLVQWAALAGILKLSTDPLAIDSTTYESRHVSRHYERRCHRTRKRLRAKDAKRGRKRTRSETRSDTVKGLPKLGIAVATACHLILSAWAGRRLPGARHAAKSAHARPDGRLGEGRDRAVVTPFFGRGLPSGSQRAVFERTCPWRKFDARSPRRVVTRPLGRRSGSACRRRGCPTPTPGRRAGGR